jgi:hypothetical protein
VVEASQEQLVLVENFITKIWDSLDPASVPDDIKSAYTEAIQVLGALIDTGSMSADTSTAAAPA